MPDQPIWQSPVVGSLSSTPANGETSVDLDVAQDDTGGLGRTPASGTLLLSFFRAQQSWEALKYISAYIGGTAPAGLTAVFAGLYQSDLETGLELLDSTADEHGTFTGTYNAQKMALQGGNASINARGIYALGLLQIGATPGSLWCTPTGNLAVQQGSYWLAAQLAGRASLPAAIPYASLAAATVRMLSTVTVN